MSVVGQTITPLQASTGTGANITSLLALSAGAMEITTVSRIQPVLSLSNLNAAAATLTVKIVNTTDTETVWRESIVKDNAADTAMKIVLPPFLTAAKTYGISVLSSNASDTNASWRIDWCDAGLALADVAKWLGVVPLALSSQQVQAVVPATQKVDVETIKTKAVTVHADGTTFPSGTVAKAGDQMDLVNAPNATALTAIGAKIEAMVLDEGDATALLAAIAAKVEAFVNDEGDAAATLAAIATAVNAAVVAGQVGTQVGAVHAKLPSRSYLAGSAAATGETQTDAAAALAGTALDAILADTNELQTDWANGGRLDLILDGRAATGDAMALTAGERTTLTAAIWGALTTGLTTAGSIGKWMLDTIGAIKLKTDTIAAGTITVTSPVTADQNVEIVQYDDYLDENSKVLPWTNSSGDWFNGDLTDATVSFIVKASDGTAILTKAGRVDTATGTQVVSVELTSAETGLLTRAGKQYTYQLLLTKATYRETEVTGDVTVTLSHSPPAVPEA